MTPNIDSKQMAIGICILYISELNQQQQQFVAQKMQFCNKHPFNCGMWELCNANSFFLAIMDLNTE